MKKTWLSGLDDDAKELMEGYYNGSPLLRERLKTLVENKISNRRKESEALKSYDSPSWASIQADNISYHAHNRGYSKIILAEASVKLGYFTRNSINFSFGEITIFSFSLCFLSLYLIIHSISGFVKAFLTQS